MKKVLSFVLVLSLVLGSFSMAFATTTNTVSKVPTVADDEDMPKTEITLEVKDPNGWDPSETQKFRLNLTNAEWTDDVVDNGAAKAVTTSGVTAGDKVAVGVAITTKGGVVAPTDITTEAKAIGDKYIELSIQAAKALPKDSTITLTLLLKSGTEPGEIKVNIDGLDSKVSSGTYTVAIVGTNNTVAKVTDDPKNTGRTTSVKATDIEIREVAVNSVKGTQTIKLTLPKGVSWTTDTKVSNDMLTSAHTVALSDISPDGRDLTVSFTAKDDPVRQALTITPYIAVGKEAKLGDIAVQIRNQAGGDNKISDESGLVIAKYVEEGVTVTTVKEADLPNIIAGRLQKTVNSDNYEVKVTLEELQDGSLINGKFVDFEFPEYVQITSGKGVEYKVNSSKINSSNANIDPKTGTCDKDDNTFEWEVSNLTNKADKIEFTIPVTVEADAAAGDLKVKVSGAKAGVAETEITVGKIVAPITAEVKISDIKTGVQNQAIADIIIKEAVAGAIRDESANNKLVLSIDDNNQGIDFSKAVAEVTAGDLEIKEAKTKDLTNKGDIIMTIDRNSIKTPGEIKISGIQVTLNRTPAEGKYELNIGGNAVVDNTAQNEGDFSDSVVATNYINVVTPADQGVKANFKIGEAKYTVNGAERTMDTASYIDGNGRTMVPVRYIADALGVSANKIVWNQATKTATIFGKSTVVITVGEKQLSVNGAIVPMDTVAVNNNGRIFVPLRFIANALGASAEWDNTNKTAIVSTIGL